MRNSSLSETKDTPTSSTDDEKDDSMEKKSGGKNQILQEQNFIPIFSKVYFLDTTELKKRPRTAFTPDQVKKLEAEFQASKYLSVGKRLELSRCLKLTETQVQWFIKIRPLWTINLL